MFGLFGKKEGIEVNDRVFMSEEARLKGLTSLLRQEQRALLLCWFGLTCRELQQQLPVYANRILPVEQAASLQPRVPIYFAEHYPQYQPEQEFFRQLGLDKATVYSSLAEPLFQLFGGQKILQLASQMGFKPDEVIENRLLSGAITNAQKKLDARVTVRINAASQADWLQRYQQLYPAEKG